jgi:hypothetical protein
MSIRLGDTIDDFCVKCKRLTNHHIVSVVGDSPAKVRCCSCYHDHDYRFEQPEPKKPTKKQLEEEDRKAKQAAGEEVESDDVDTDDVDDDSDDVDDDPVDAEAFVADAEIEEPPTPRKRKR